MADSTCRHCSTEELIVLALASAHPRLRERCDRAKILAVLEDKHAAYDAHGVHSLLVRKYGTVEEQLETAEAAPSTFLTVIASGDADAAAWWVCGLTHSVCGVAVPSGVALAVHRYMPM